MSEHQANLALVERAEGQWKVGKHFNTLPPSRKASAESRSCKKPTLLQKVLKFIFGK